MSGWVFPLCHQLMVTLAPLDAEPPPVGVLPLLLLLQAATVTAAASAIAAATGFEEPRIGSHLLMMPGVMMRRNYESL
jgi:hypothetical protein